ncbi:hypothetical protein AG0111_0g10745 [Alternaria gaisen]|uniref:Uncharacterized protein n=1 Tax=Alternaria gaisen TaxID=167740 RepID=A0ACB6F879_9PLEO|nr:hypothetical protein AG0111_0g10745 [Alternaria gaisen]
MLGIDYPDSDEEDVVPATQPELTNISAAVAPAPEPLSASAPLEQPPTSSGPVNGPAQGPAQGPTVSPPPEEDVPSNDAAPGSTYANTRALIQNLTLPTVPNFDIPPSPPGSPPQRATKKFAQFLELKKKGQHFNQRLETSSVLRDPGHMQKLMDFAGISEQDSYTSTLPEDVAIPAIFPEWAYVEELRASQKRISKTREQERSKAPREALEFVSASKNASSSTTGKRKELEHRGKDDQSSRSKLESGSRSPKRRRSRSRERR